MSYIRIEDKYSHIECDEPGCDERSPPAEELLKSHGLVGLGWHCSGGVHYCPKHVARGGKQ